MGIENDIDIDIDIDIAYALGPSPCAFPKARNEVIDNTADNIDLRTNLRTNREGCV